MRFPDRGKLLVATPFVLLGLWCVLGWARHSELRCDRTRVASMQYSRAFSQLFFRWIPGMKADRFHHDISHMANDARMIRGGDRHDAGRHHRREHIRRHRDVGQPRRHYADGATSASVETPIAVLACQPC